MILFSFGCTSFVTLISQYILALFRWVMAEYNNYYITGGGGENQKHAPQYLKTFYSWYKTRAKSWLRTVLSGQDPLPSGAGDTFFASRPAIIYSISRPGITI